MFSGGYNWNNTTKESIAKVLTRWIVFIYKIV